MASKLKRFFFLILLSALTSSLSFAQDEVELSDIRTYTYLPKCIEKAYMNSDSVRLHSGPIEEINWLRSNRTECEENSAVTRRLSLRLMELGDNEYGDDNADLKVDKKELYRESLKWARIAVKEDTTDDINFENISMAFAANVSVASLKGKAQLADSVRIYAEKAVEINSDNHRAYHILGRWHYEVSKLSWIIRKLSKLVFNTSPSGSFQLAVEYFNRAIALNDIPVHHYWLGLAYLESGKKNEALSQFKYLINLEDDGKYNATFFQKEAKKLLEKYG